MRKIYAAISFILLATLIGAGAVYQLVVKKRLEELAASKQRQQQLEDKIIEMEDNFYGAVPQKVIQVYRENAEPWKSAALQRTEFFKMDADLFATKVPEDAIPRFYYKEELPKRVEALEASMYRNRTILDDSLFGIPKADHYKRGTNPTAEEIEEHFATHAYGAAIAQLLSKGGAEWIRRLELWPTSTALDGQVGKVDLMGCGVAISIGTEDFVKFLEMLRTEQRFFSVDAIKIINTELTQRTDNPVIEVEFILMQSDFHQSDIRVAEGSGQSAEQSQNLFSSRGGDGDVVEDDLPSWWQTFRRRFLPF